MVNTARVTSTVVAIRLMANTDSNTAAKRGSTVVAKNVEFENEMMTDLTQELVIIYSCENDDWFVPKPLLTCSTRSRQI